MAGKRRKGREPVPLEPDVTPPPPPVDLTPPPPPAPAVPPAEPVAPPAAEPPPPPPPLLPPPPPPAPPVSPPIVMAPKVSRRQARQLRHKEQRRKFGMVGGAAIAIGALIVAGGLVFGVHKVVTSHDGKKRSQTTVLFQVQAADRTAAASVLLAHDPATKTGVEVLVQPRVITEVCGYGQQNFGAVLALPNGEVGSQQALTSMLNGVTVDGSWILTPAQLTKLINTIGGVTVENVDVNVVKHTAGGGGQILVPAGSNQKLNGTQAVEYALYSTSVSADAAAQLERLNQVVSALLLALPRTPTAIAALLRQLGPGGTSTLGASRLANLLSGLGDDSRTTAALFPTDLPVTPIDAGGSAPSYEVDTSTTGVTQLVQTRLADSVPKGAGGQRPTVELLNGVGTPGLVQTACPRLASHGLAYAGSDNAATFDNPVSQVEIQSDADIDLGHTVASALGLPTSDVVLSNDDETVARVVVILGNDYKP